MKQVAIVLIAFAFVSAWPGTEAARAAALLSNVPLDVVQPCTASFFLYDATWTNTTGATIYIKSIWLTFAGTPSNGSLSTNVFAPGASYIANHFVTAPIVSPTIVEASFTPD